MVVDKAEESNYILPSMTYEVIIARSAEMKTHTITDAKNDISTIIREAEKEEVLITQCGKPAVAVIGFHDDDDGFVPISISL